MKTRLTIRTLLGGFFAVIFSLYGSQAAAVIAGSTHDFSGTFGSGEICVVCHTPHNAQGAADGPLWNHDTSVAAYTVYTSIAGTLDGVAANPPAGQSKLCLGCHDGTVSLDSYGGGAGTGPTMGAVPANFGTNLSDDHPISISYSADPTMNPDTDPVTIGGATTATGTIASLMVPAGTVECSSCHDVHNTYTIAGTPLLKISQTATASGLCLTCHAK